jgi:hypothetical protein
MHTRGWMMVAPLALGVALMFGLGGCFKSPTSPTSFSSLNGGGTHGGGTGGGGNNGGGGLTPTPTPTTGGGGGGTGSISGTITGSGGESVTILAAGSGGSFSTTISGDGTYTIHNVANGSYSVEAYTASYSHFGGYTGTVTVSGGSAVTGINITLY